MPRIHTTTKKEAVRLLVKERMSTREVARLLNISQKSAANILKVNKENVDVKQGGRPRKLTIQDA